jgi:hypothetical protein
MSVVRPTVWCDEGLDLRILALEGHCGRERVRLTIVGPIMCETAWRVTS